jgi:hypothetical protein
MRLGKLVLCIIANLLMILIIAPVTPAYEGDGVVEQGEIESY